MGFFSSINPLNAASDLLGVGGGDKKAEKTQKEIAQLYADLGLPSIDDLTPEYDEYYSVGKYKPAMQKKSMLLGYDPSQEVTDAQFKSLDELSAIVDGEGLTDADRARLREIERQELTRERGQREAILQNAAERGAGGSGTELAALLSAQQEGADRASDRDLGVEKLAEDRVLSAIANLGSLGTTIRGQEFGEAQGKASAQDMINAFNVQNKNEAKKYNLGNKQSIANANVDLMNKNQANKADAYQQNYLNQITQLQGQSGGLKGVAAAQQSGGKAKEDFYGNLIGGAAVALSDENAKTNVEDGSSDLREFLGDLTVNKYDYKDKENGEGKHYSVMAQDLEKSQVGKSMVEEGNDGLKRVNYGKGLGVMMALIKDLGDRVDGLEDSYA